MIEAYYLIFCQSDRWFAKFLHRNFSHVFVYKHILNKQYIQIQPIWNLDVSRRDNIEQSFKELKDKHKMKIVKVECDLTRIRKNFFFFLSTRWGVYNCVLLAKYMLALRSWCFTPYGLFKCLTRGLYRKKNKQLFNIEVV